MKLLPLSRLVVVLLCNTTLLFVVAASAANSSDGILIIGTNITNSTTSTAYSNGTLSNGTTTNTNTTTSNQPTANTNSTASNDTTANTNITNLTPPPDVVIDGTKSFGNAMDIIVFRSTTDNSSFYSTPWFVMFDKLDSDDGVQKEGSGVGGGALDVLGELWGTVFGGDPVPDNSVVRLVCNGEYLSTTLTLQDDGSVAFPEDGMTAPPMEDLRLCLQNADPNQNVFLVRYEHHEPQSQPQTRGRRRTAQDATTATRFVECRLHLWGANDSVVVTDIDGTLTQEAFPMNEFLWGSTTPLHAGVTELHTRIAQTGIRTMYLTGRPISYATFTRDFLDRVIQLSIESEVPNAQAEPPSVPEVLASVLAIESSRQSNVTTSAQATQQEPQYYGFPTGPLITDREGAMSTIIGIFKDDGGAAKLQSLRNVENAMEFAGRSTSYPIFVAGFGDLPNDQAAYQGAGMDDAVNYVIGWEDDQVTSHIYSVAEPDVIFKMAYASPDFAPAFFNRMRDFVPLDVYGQNLELVISNLGKTQ